VYHFDAVVVLDQNLMTGLHWAASRNLDLMAELLLRHHSDPNHFDIHNNTPMLYAIKHKNYKLMKKLLVARALVVTEFRDLSKAVEDEVVKLLLTKAKFLISTLVMVKPKKRYAQWSQLVANWLEHIQF